MTKATKAKTWAAVILAMLALPGCQATRSADASFGVQAPVATQTQTAPFGPAAMLSLPSTPTAPQGYQQTSCMGFGFGGKTAAPLIIGLILFSPVLLLLSFLGG